VAYFNQQWFTDAVQAAQESYETCRPDIIVGISMGGAVAMNLASHDTPQVLLAPAWRAWGVLRFGEARQVKAATVVIHGDQDLTVFPRYSSRLLARSQPGQDATDLVAAVERRLREGLGGEQELYRVAGRLVFVRNEGHRCKGQAALRALLTVVEELVRPCP
jgi:pimeloyl-ACP methyl ester carboxylesterase